MNHLTSERLLSSNIVPTLQEKLRLHWLQRDLTSFRAAQWCSPQYGQTTSWLASTPQRVSMIVCLQTSSLLKYIVIEMSESNLEKSIILLLLIKTIAIICIRNKFVVKQYIIAFFDYCNIYIKEIQNMKFKEGDNLSWDLFLEACKEVDEKCKKHLNESNQMSTSFSSINDAEQYFRSIGGITVEEFEHKMQEEYGI